MRCFILFGKNRLQIMDQKSEFNHKTKRKSPDLNRGMLRASDSFYHSAELSSFPDMVSARTLADHVPCSRPDSSCSLRHLCSPNNARSSDCSHSLASSYLIACSGSDTESCQKDLLYRTLGPVFFGRKQAADLAELADFFRRKYDIDVTGDFFEGDDHYEEYQEARQAISEGMTIYGGSISFDNCILADLADMVWDDMEREGKEKFRRINTLLEE